MHGQNRANKFFQPTKRNRSQAKDSKEITQCKSTALYRAKPKTMPISIGTGPMPFVLQRIHACHLAGLLLASCSASRADTLADVQVTQTALEYRQFDKVEVTGSSILQPETRVSTPVRVLTRADMSKLGVSSLDQAVQSLTDQINGQNSGQVANTILGGPSTASLHGLANGTLVLLNGRRMPSYGLQTLWGERSGVDLTLVPLNAIDRIEVLSSGASSRYGSDALAGVINIITKTHLRQNQLALEVGQPQHAGGQSRQFEMSWGQGQFDRDGYSFQLHWQSQKQNSVNSNSRPVSAQAARPVSINGSTYWTGLSDASTYTAPANIQDAQGQKQVHPNLSSNNCGPNLYTLPYPDGTECRSNPQNWLSLYPQQVKHQLFAQGELALNQQHAIWGELLLNKASQRFSTSTPPAADIALQDGSTASFLAETLGPSLDQSTSQGHRAAMGLKGQWRDWDYVLSASNAQHRSSRNLSSNAFLTDSSFASLGLTREELLQEPSKYSASTRAKLASLWDGSYRWLETGQTQQQTLEWLASREIGEGIFGPWMLGTGLNYRQESYSYRSASPDSTPDMHGKRQVLAAHAELQIPVSDSVQAIASVRKDRYSDFGTANTGKLSGKWQATPNWLWRASVGNGFRAPTIAQTSQDSAQVGWTVDANGVDYIKVYAQGNPDLQPEKSRMSQIGTQWQASREWTLGMDWWLLNVTNSFGILSDTAILENPELRARYLQTQDDGSRRLIQQNLNLGRKQLQGIDWQISSRHPLEKGQLRTQLTATQYLIARNQLPPAGEWVSELGQLNPKTGQAMPRIKARWLISYESANNFGWGAFVDYLSGNHEMYEAYDFITQTSQTFSRKVPAFWTLGLTAQWRPNDRWTWQGLLSNALDKSPPLRLALVDSSGLNGVDTRYADYMGRSMKLKVSYKF